MQIVLTSRKGSQGSPGVGGQDLDSHSPKLSPVVEHLVLSSFSLYVLCQHLGQGHPVLQEQRRKAPVAPTVGQGEAQ